MRILHAINQVGALGGAEASLRAILTSRMDGFEHGLVVLGGDPSSLAPFLSAAIPCFAPEAPPSGRRAQVEHIRCSIRSFTPDLLHTSLFDSDLAGRVAGWFERVPTISSLVNTPYIPEALDAEVVSRAKLATVRAVDGLLARWLTNGFHAISGTAAEHAVRYLGVDRGQIRIVPRGRDAAVFTRPSSEERRVHRAELDWGDRPVVINVARQEPQKGQRYLLEAHAALLDDHPDALLVIVGREGRATPGLKAQARSAGLTEAVRWLGARTDVAELIGAADVFAFPSVYEGLGGAAIEALAIGTPIVASDIPALREVVGTDRGWLVPAGDPSALSQTIGRLINGGEEVDRRAARGREVFEQRYELGSCVAGMAALYRDIEGQLGSSQQRRRLRRLRLDLGERQDGDPKP
jgi:glycosyltransferase involved in cell wall biosynthesis